MIRYATVTVSGSPMAVLLAAPEAASDPVPAPVPAMVLMPHRPGIDIYTIDRAQRLAAEGILTVAPDLYHRQPLDVPTRDGKDLLDDDGIVPDIGAALGLVQGDPRVDPARIGILGHCQGGRTALLGLVTYPEAFRAGGIYYGGRVFKRMGPGAGPAPFDGIGRIACPVQGMFGNRDKNPSPEDVDRIDAEMTRCGIVHDFHRYDEAGHGFQDFTDQDRYCEGPALDSWEKTLAFFRRELGLEPAPA